MDPMCFYVKKILEHLSQVKKCDLEKVKKRMPKVQ